MSKRDHRLVLYQMRDHAQELIELCQDKQHSDLDQNRLLSLAVVRLLEIVGEAANRIPKTEQNNYPQIPWPQIIGLRNRLIHGYDRIDFDVVWQIIEHDLPSLVNELNKILK